MALLKASTVLEKAFKSSKVDGYRVGAEIVRDACRAPLSQIITNSGLSPEIIIQKAIKAKGGFGYNAATGKWVDMYECGVIDPLKVVRCALENASSVARMLLSVGCAVVEDELFSSHG